MKAWAFVLWFLMPTAAATTDDTPVGLVYTKQWDSVCNALLDSPIPDYNSDLVDKSVESAARNLQIQHMAKYDASQANGAGIDEYFEYAYPEYPFVSEARAAINDDPHMRQHQCEPLDFKMLISDFSATNCQQLCMHCLPGSMPLCYSKSRRFPGIARTCLCSYDTEDPYNNAAFSIHSSSSAILEVRNERYKNKRELLVTSKGSHSIIFI